MGVEVLLLPDAGPLQHPYAARPGPGVLSGLLDMGVEPRRIRNVEVRQGEGLSHVRPAFPGVSARGRASYLSCPREHYPWAVRGTHTRN